MSTARLVGDFELIRELGRGGMGQVFLARQRSLGREIAVKQIDGLAGGREAAARFVREARLAGSLNHPNVVTVLDFLEVDGAAFIAMEYVPGGSLRPYLPGLDLAGLGRVMEGILAGLRHAHAAGIVHRDLKPENVLVTADGAVKIADFGLAKASETAGSLEFETRSGAIIGTPRYMAPEQIRGDPVDGRCDLYSLGLIAYEQLTGWLPFDELNSPTAVLLAQLHDPIPDPIDRQPALDPRLSRWITRLLHKDSGHRPSDPRDVWQELEEILLALLGPRWRHAEPLSANQTDPNQASAQAPIGVVSQTIITGPTPAAHLPARPPSGASADRADHQPRDRDGSQLPSGQVTLLFSDIEGSTRLLHELGDGYGEVLAAHHRLLREIWVAHDGVEAGTEGDSFFVAFRTADRAVAAAQAAQQTIARSAQQLHKIKVRIGVHTGAPQIREESYWGIDVHYAARLCAAANGGQVLLSATTQPLVAQLDLGLQDLGEHALRDFPAARHIFHLPANGQPASAFPAIHTRKTGQTNLPDQLSSFIGRETELTALRELVADNRIVTLVGAGGVGKTRLALRLGSDLLDASDHGVWFIDLAPVTDPELVAATIAKTLRLHQQPGQDVVEQLIDALSDRRLVLIADNCEHLIDSAARLMDQVGRCCPEVVVIATSREPLGIGGEQIYRVPSLKAPNSGAADLDEIRRSEAVQLFVDRARQQRPEFSLTDTNALTVGRVCRRLDGIALAIELAAVRLQALSIEELDGRLDQRLRLLKTSDRTALPRQQTLRALIDWSYQLLSDDEQSVLNRSSVFAASGFDLPAAETVCPSPEIDAFDVLDHIQALVDKSLIQADDSAGSVRYRLLETIRQYATTALTTTPEHPNIQTAHRDHYLMLALSAQAQLPGPNGPRLCDQLELEHDNLRLALANCLTDPNPNPGLELGSALSVFWSMRGYASEGGELLAAQLARLDAQAPTIHRGRALRAQSALLLYQDTRTAIALGEQALEIARAHADDMLAAKALDEIANASVFRGDYDRALQLSEQATKLARAVDDQVVLANAANVRGMALAALGEDARPSFEKFREISHRHGAVYGEAMALNNLAQIALERGDASTARAHLEEAQRVNAQSPDPILTAGAAQGLGYVCYLEGNHADAARLFTESLDASERLHATLEIGMSVFGLALAAADADTAAALHGAADTIFNQTGVELFTPEREFRDRAHDQLRSVLGTEQYQAAYEAGTVLTRPDAIALARAAMPAPQTKPRLSRGILDGD